MKTHKCYGDDELLRKFQIDVIESSPDGFHGLGVTIDVKRFFFLFKILTLPNNLSVFSIYLLHFRSKAPSSNLIASWIQEKLSSSSALPNLVSISSFSLRVRVPNIVMK